MSTLPWSMTRLDAVADIVTGSTPATSDRSNYGQEYMFVSPADIGKGKFVRSTIKNLSEVGYSRTRHVPKGSVLFVCIGSTIGKVGIAGDDLATNQQINALIPSHAVDSDFLFYAASTLSGIVRNQAGEQAVPLVSKAQFSRFEIPTPPLGEQKRIASTISDADRLIESLERLISKKQAIKQGMMQELLTGRRRLQGFSKSWQATTFGDLVRIQRGSVLTRAQAGSGRIPVVAGGKAPAGYTDKANRVGRTITISASGASAGYVALYNEPIFASDCSTIGSSRHYDLDFIYYSLLLRQDDIYRAQTGGAQPHIHACDVYPMEIRVPTDMQEQIAIAQVLVDADKEIMALERRLESARGIKQGMMQELLTGRTRLPFEGESA